MNTSTKIQASLLIIVNFLLAHYVVSSLPIRLDFTQENIFSLSSSSKNLLSKIEEPVELDFYYTRSAEDLPIRFKNFAERVEQMLIQYKKAGNGLIRLNIIDPQPDTPEEEAATAAGLHAQSLPSGDRIFLGLAARQGDIERVIPFFDWNKEGLLEYDLSKLVYETQVLAKPRLAIITGLPIKAPAYPAMPSQPAPEDQYILQELETGFQVEVVEASATELPADIDMIAVIHPQNLSDDLLYAIDQHTLSGKPLFVAVDPSSRTNKNVSQQMGGGMMGRPSPNDSSTFEPFFTAWGIEYDTANAVADPNLALSQPNFIEPSWLVIGEENRDNTFNPISNLGATLVVEAGALKLAEDSEATFEPVLKTSAEAGTVSSMILGYAQQGALLRQIESGGEELVLAGMLSGKLKSAFPDGKPKSDSDAETATAEDSENHLLEGDARVFIIADTDWLMDGFSVQRINFLGMPAVQPLNDNPNMASNIMEFLGGSKDLIGIRGKGSSNRSFDVVHQLEVEAQQAYQTKLQEVEEQLSTITQQIQEIASQQQGSGLIVATPELQEILKKNQEEQARLQGERREIRRELRSDIESLGSLLLWSNRLYAPIILLLIGIFFFKSRKQRSF